MDRNCCARQSCIEKCEEVNQPTTVSNQQSFASCFSIQIQQNEHDKGFHQFTSASFKSTKTLVCVVRD
jgi:hypothetical protein